MPDIHKISCIINKMKLNIEIKYFKKFIQVALN